MDRVKVVSGIYSIVNIATGRTYVGSSKDIAKRWSHHVGMLERGLHTNRALAEDWLKHGAAGFRFSVLERVESPDELTKAEQIWLNTLNPHYNFKMASAVTAYATRPTLNQDLRHAQAEMTWRFRHEDGREVVVFNVPAFCIEEGLNRANLYKLRQGKIRTYKGWRYVEPEPNAARAKRMRKARMHSEVLSNHINRLQGF